MIALLNVDNERIRKMTPAEKLGYKVGDKFVVNGSHSFSEGSIIELEKDNGGETPLFKLISGNCKYELAKNGSLGSYCNLCILTKIEDEKPKAHKHAELIKAKANDMDLIRFVKLDYNQRSGWVVQADDIQSSTDFNKRNEYFLCLPKHNAKGQCLHWLNGGYIKVNGESYWDDAPRTWCKLNDFMDSDLTISIKPRKEKRWIAVRKSDKYVESILYSLKEACEDANDSKYWDCYEIKVEV